jgi:hypothetical protein
MRPLSLHSHRPMRLIITSDSNSLFVMARQCTLVRLSFPIHGSFIRIRQRAPRRWNLTFGVRESTMLLLCQIIIRIRQIVIRIRQIVIRIRQIVIRFRHASLRSVRSSPKRPALDFELQQTFHAVAHSTDHQFTVWIVQSLQFGIVQSLQFRFVASCPRVHVPRLQPYKSHDSRLNLGINARL